MKNPFDIRLACSDNQPGLAAPFAWYELAQRAPENRYHVDSFAGSFMAYPAPRDIKEKKKISK